MLWWKNQRKAEFVKDLITENRPVVILCPWITVVVIDVWTQWFKSQLNYIHPLLTLPSFTTARHTLITAVNFADKAHSKRHRKLNMHRKLNLRRPGSKFHWKSQWANKWWRSVMWPNSVTYILKTHQSRPHPPTPPYTGGGRSYRPTQPHPKHLKHKKQTSEDKTTNICKKTTNKGRAQARNKIRKE